MNYPEREKRAEPEKAEFIDLEDETFKRMYQEYVLQAAPFGEDVMSMREYILSIFDVSRSSTSSDF